MCVFYALPTYQLHMTSSNTMISTLLVLHVQQYLIHFCNLWVCHQLIASIPIAAHIMEKNALRDSEHLIFFFFQVICFDFVLHFGSILPSRVFPDVRMHWESANR